MEKTPENILVVQIGKLGDMVLTSPLLYELKRIFPKASLKVLASPVNQEFVSHLKVVDEVIIYQKNLLKDLFLASKLKKNNFDLWIDVKDGYSRTSASLLKIAKPKLSLGYNTKEKIFDVDMKDYAKGKHAVELSLAPVHYFGQEPQHKRPVVSDFLSSHNHIHKFDLLINISAGSASRYLEKEKWTKLIARILNVYPHLKIHLIGIKKDAETINYINNAVKVGHLTSNYNYRLPELINILNNAKVIISADTSIVHFVSGLDKPVIALYPNVDWNYERFKPLSHHTEVIISKDEKGIGDIDHEQIFEKFLHLYKKNQ